MLYRDGVFDYLRYVVCAKQAEVIDCHPAVIPSMKDQQSEERFRSLVEATSDFIWEVDRDIVFVYASPKVKDLLGYEPEEVIGKTPFDLMTPDQAERSLRLDGGIIEASEPFTIMETAHQHKDGRCVDIEVSGVPIFDKDGHHVGFRGISRDVTDRKLAEEAKAQSEQQYRQIVESMADNLFVIDLEGIIVEANPAVCRTYGYTRDELIGLAVAEFIHPDYRHQFGDLVRQVQTDDPFYAESVNVRKDGSVFNVTVRGTVFQFKGKRHLLVITRDITRRKLTEESLKQSLEELQAIYDGVADGLLVADIETKRFVRANPLMCRMLGYSEDELLSMSVPNIHRPEDLPDVLELFRAQVEGRVPVAKVVPFLRKDGSVFFADINAGRIVYNQRPCGIAFFRDITERKQAEEAIEKERRQLRRMLDVHEQNRKLVAYEIHDGLVQSLVGAKMLFESAARGIDAQCSDDHRKSYQTGLRLLDDAVSQARAVMGGQRPLILDERGLVAAIEYLVLETADHHGTKIEFTHDVEFDRLAPPLETAVFRIVQESLTNARRHSQSERIRIGLTQQDGHVRVEVEDWGIGFDPKNVAEKCLGLEGLRERTRLFGGSAAIESGPNRGTRIAVELPLVEA